MGCSQQRAFGHGGPSHGRHRRRRLSHVQRALTLRSITSRVFASSSLLSGFSSALSFCGSVARGPAGCWDAVADGPPSSVSGADENQAEAIRRRGI